MIATSIFFSLLTSFNLTTQNPWAEVTQPTRPPSESIGSYASGCIRGAVELPVDDSGLGVGYQTVRPSRHRHFAHPDMIDFIQRLSGKVKADGLGTLLVSDIGQPRGGPMPSDHLSHQIGLDVDIWYWQPALGYVLTPAERENLGAKKYVSGENVTADWTPQKVSILKIAAEDARINRIFVSPVIKKSICSQHRGEAWLQKLRPWPDHEDHFHTRLVCPSDGKNKCVEQAAIPAGDGCDSIDEDISIEEGLTIDLEPYSSTVFSKLPKECDEVLKE